ncbi:MAG: hypothetical protein E6H97_09745 [Chloroflexi bacterium]|nr:MAG: hypothetical protein E6H97_09745 [Chloroflexota bacterium]
MPGSPAMRSSSLRESSGATTPGRPIACASTCGRATSSRRRNHEPRPRPRSSRPRPSPRGAFDGPAAVKELGISYPDGTQLVVVENQQDVHNVIVCTLCSCYPWPVLGLPPTWYKSPPYRSRMVREPRTVLEEFDLTLPDEVAVNVWDSSSDVRYMVLPQRPQGTEGWTEEQLAGIVTRDCMIGVARPRISAESGAR